MAHVEDMCLDDQGRWIVGEHTCVEELTGDYGPCVDDWCIEHGHQWFCVSEILPDGSGEIVTFRIDGKWVEAFETLVEAIEAAEEKWSA